MKQLNNKEMALALAMSDDEKKVVEILKSQGYWDDLSAWKYYGDNENNFSVIGAQQNSPDTALREQIINSVDAVLMKEAQLRDIDPEGKNAPRSVKEALHSFFGIYNGDLSNITKRERKNLAMNVIVVATGSKSAPCYTIIDKGEGQSPARMPHTLLSLSKSNKLKIQFVQGKHNMGRTGAFPYCGDERMQYVLSRRCPDIVSAHDGDRADMWGFTIIRRVHIKGMRSSAYMYLAPDGKIPTFKADSLPILPGEYPQAYKKSMVYGTFIKHYNYQIGPGLRTNIVFDLGNRLSLLIPKIALPIRLIESRLGYKGHSLQANMNGLTVRLDEDVRENLEEGYPSSANIRLEDDVLPISIYAFKRKKSSKYINSEGVIFTFNGQTHGHLDKAFFRRKKVGMSYLADSILTIVDCSGLGIAKTEDLFMNSRDRLRDGKLLKAIEKELEIIISSHKGLKKLREKRRREDIENSLADSKPLAEILENILKKSPALAFLFNKGTRLTNPFKVKKDKGGVVYKGNYFPTIFELDKKFPVDKPRVAAIDKRLRLQYTTDAPNDYLVRSNEPGQYELMLNGKTYPFVLNFWNGYANLNIELPDSVQEGEVLQFKSTLIDNSKTQPFEEEFFVVIGTKQESTPSDGGEGRKSKGDKDDKEANKNDKMSLPEVVEVRRNDWDNYEFDIESALKVTYNSKTWDFFVNMDNGYLKNEMKANTKSNAKLLEARYKYGLTLFALSMLKDHDESDSDGDVEAMIMEVTKSLARVLLPIIDNLGNLEVEEAEQINVSHDDMVHELIVPEEAVIWN